MRRYKKVELEKRILLDFTGYSTKYITSIEYYKRKTGIPKFKYSGNESLYNFDKNHFPSMSISIIEKLITYPRESTYLARTHCNEQTIDRFRLTVPFVFPLIFPPRDRDIQPLPPFVPHCPRLSGRISRPSGD